MKLKIMPENFEQPKDESQELTPELQNIVSNFEEELKRLTEWAEKANELHKTNPEEYEKIMKTDKKEKDKEKRKERTNKTSNEKIKKLLQEAETQGIDMNDEETIIGMGADVIEQLNDLFQREYNLVTPKQKLPPVLPFDTDNAFYAESYTNEQGGKEELNLICVGTINDILNGNTMSEELAHYYRFKLQPEGQENEHLTHEFFGFLGRKMFKRAVAQEPNLTFLDNEEGSELSGRKEVMEILRKIRENLRLLETAIEEKDNNFEKMLIQKDIDKFTEIRKDILTHRKGYEYAFNVDMDKIQDYGKLFGLTNEEVRKRFFTDKPDYSGL